MPGYEPFLLCDSHVHTTWSDGRLSLRDVIDLYGQTEFSPRFGGRARLSIACHPHHRTTRRMEIGTCYLWAHRKELAHLVDVWEAANRDDLFSVTSLKHYPYVANGDFHKAKHLPAWKMLVRSAKTLPAIKAALEANVDIAITLFRKESWAAA